MKRILAILMSLTMILALAACGKTEEYTYDYIPPEYPKMYVPIISRSMPIKGGAFLNTHIQDLQGKERNSEESWVAMRCLFNEETKTLMPLCMVPSCSHGNADCFGNAYHGNYPLTITGVYKDLIFDVRESPDDKDRVEVLYYGLDGMIRDTVDYTPELTMPNGESLKNGSMLNDNYVSFGTKLYFELSTEAPGYEDSLFLENGEIEYAHWILCYDLEEKNWTQLNSEPYLSFEQYTDFSENDLLSIDSPYLALAQNINRFEQNGELYLVEPISEKLILTNIVTGKQQSVPTENRSLTFCSETEKGMIFYWQTISEDGKLEPDSYTVKENYRDVTYFYPLKFLYVTKEDILDGTIDEPWFYDPETYSFVLQ